MDPDYEPSEMEIRTLYGLKMEQRRNDSVIDAKLFENITSKNKNVCVAFNNFDYCLIETRWHLSQRFNLRKSIWI